jgi:hypothetical protein
MLISNAEYQRLNNDNFQNKRMIEELKKHKQKN